MLYKEGGSSSNSFRREIDLVKVRNPPGSGETFGLMDRNRIEAVIEDEAAYQVVVQ